MTQKLKVGDEVWAHARVQEVGTPPNGYPQTYTVKVGFISSSLDEWFRPDTELRTEADFKDPLDEAIVEAAIEYVSLSEQASAVFHHEALEKLRDAVQAKLDAEKPKTVDEVLADIWESASLAGSTECDKGWTAGRHAAVNEIREVLEDES